MKYYLVCTICSGHFNINKACIILKCKKKFIQASLCVRRKSLNLNDCQLPTRWLKRLRLLLNKSRIVSLRPCKTHSCPFNPAQRQTVSVNEVYIILHCSKDMIISG